MADIKEIFQKISETVSDHVLEWVQGENEDCDEEMPTIKLLKHEEAVKCFATCLRCACENNFISSSDIAPHTANHKNYWFFFNH